MLSALVLSDLHVGSAFALFPPRFTLSTGALVGLNVGQQYLYQCWQDFKARLPATLDILVLVGDIIDGQNPREGGADLTEVKPEWQQRAALEFLAPVAERCQAVYAVRGTHYHSGEAGAWEEALAKRLGAVPDPMGNHAPYWHHLDIEGVYLDIAHRQSATIRYGSSMLERELQFMLMRTQAEAVEPDDLILRGHVHTYRYVNDDGFLAVSCPAWQIPASFVQRSITPNRKRARLFGGLLIKLWPGRKRMSTRNREEFVEIKFLDYNQPALGRLHYGEA